MSKLNWPQFDKTLRDKGLKIFTPLELTRIFDVSYNTIRKFLFRYAKKDFITKLKNGLYILTNEKPSDFLIANKLYSPSYISLETALSYYHIIPESVYSITSLSTKATREFSALNIQFSYQKIKKSAFTGYLPIRVKENIILIAEPEKALVDYLYFVSLGKKKKNERMNLSKISKKKVLKYEKLFVYQPLDRLVKEIL